MMLQAGIHVKNCHKQTTLQCQKSPALWLYRALVWYFRIILRKAFWCIRTLAFLVCRFSSSSSRLSILQFFEYSRIWRFISCQTTHLFSSVTSSLMLHLFEKIIMQRGDRTSHNSLIIYLQFVYYQNLRVTYGTLKCCLKIYRVHHTPTAQLMNNWHMQTLAH